MERGRERERELERERKNERERERERDRGERDGQAAGNVVKFWQCQRPAPVVATLRELP